MSLPKNTLEFVIRLLGRASCAEDVHISFASKVVGLMTEAEAFNAAHRCIGGKAPVITTSDPALWAKHMGGPTKPREKSLLVNFITTPDLALLNKVFAAGGAAAISPDNAALVAKWYTVVESMLAFQLLPAENVQKTGMLPVAAALLAAGGQDGAERERSHTDDKDEAEAEAGAVAVGDAGAGFKASSRPVATGAQHSPTPSDTGEQGVAAAVSTCRQTVARAGDTVSQSGRQVASGLPQLVPGAPASASAQPGPPATGYPYPGAVRWPYYYPAAGSATPEGAPAAAVAAAAVVVVAAAAAAAAAADTAAAVAAPAGKVENAAASAQPGSAQQALHAPQQQPQPQALPAPRQQRAGFKGNEFVGFEVRMSNALARIIACPGCGCQHISLFTRWVHRV